MSKEPIIVFAEEAAGYEELCSKARSLGAIPTALFVGSDESARQVADFGARVLSFGPVPEGAMLEDCVTALSEVLHAEEPRLIMTRASKRTQCIAGRLGVRLGIPVVNDASAVEEVDGSIELGHLVHGGAAWQVERATGAVIALVPAGSFETDAAPAPGTVERQSASIEPGPIRKVGMEEKQEEVVDLGSAKRVVCVGRGIGNQDNLTAAKGFAEKCGAEMACTRPVAEGENWMPRSRYLGVSGASVKPDVYLALGVSGQVQHTVGVGDSKIVAVVNKDKNAPFFKNCDFGLVADVEKVLPVLESLL